MDIEITVVYDRVGSKVKEKESKQKIMENIRGDVYFTTLHLEINYELLSSSSQNWR